MARPGVLLLLSDTEAGTNNAWRYGDFSQERGESAVTFLVALKMNM